jgi:hypothetical protein
MKALISFASSAVLVLALSFAIVWPLWSLATKDRLAYTAAVGAAFALAFVLLIARAVRRGYTRERMRRRSSARGRARSSGE